MNEIDIDKKIEEYVSKLDVKNIDINDIINPVTLDESLKKFEEKGVSMENLNWRLPTIEELGLMYENLYRNKIGGFDNNNIYWSSSEYDNNTAWLQGFRYGLNYNYNKTSKYQVRPVHSFKSNVDYSIGDNTGTGFIFYKDGNNYKECAKEYLPYKLTWNEAMDYFKNEDKEKGVSMENLDWRLPTIEELGLMYQLYNNERGNFRKDVYWSSTEYCNNSAKLFNFRTGKIDNSGKSDRIYHRLVREFQSNEFYEVGKETDTGVIIKRIGDDNLYTYLECELQDHSELITWYDAMKININEYDVVYQFLLKNGADKLVFECLDKLALSYTGS